MKHSRNWAESKIRVAEQGNGHLPRGHSADGKEARVAGDTVTLHHQWARLVPEEQWGVYKAALESVRRAGMEFVLGGAFALASFTGRWRNTKDIDLYIRPADRDNAIVTLTGAGFTDYYSTLPYDRRWIHRMTRDGVIVDLIWAMANLRTQVEGSWFGHAPLLNLRGEPVSILSPEDLLWCKLYVMQRDRCDWPDLINLLYATGAELDWERLLARLDQEFALLAGLLHVFSWICPHRARLLPRTLRERLHLPNDAASADTLVLERRRIELLDSRPWFAALQPEDQPMKL